MCRGHLDPQHGEQGPPRAQGMDQGRISPCCGCVAWGGGSSQGAWMGGDAPPVDGPLPWWLPMSLTLGAACRAGMQRGQLPQSPTLLGPLLLPVFSPVLLQPNECIKTLADMKVTLKELCTELREERRGASELQQQFTKAKAAWEMERAELKCHIAQVGAPGTPWAGRASPCLLEGWGAACALCQALGWEQGGTVGILISSHSGRRVSMATGPAWKSDCGAAEDALYSSAGFVWGGWDGTGLNIPPEDRQLRAASEPTSPPPRVTAQDPCGCCKRDAWLQGRQEVEGRQPGH